MTKKDALKKLNGKSLIKKAFPKKLTTCLLVSILGLMTVLGLAGCQDNHDDSASQAKEDDSGINYVTTFLTDVYILVPNEKGEYILHKGDIFTYSKEFGYRAAKYGSDKLVLGCGEEVYTDNYKAYDKKPKKDGHYVGYCKGCFETEDLSK